MNDHFLNRIRVEPPADFLTDLKARLDKQPPPPKRSRRGTWFRGFLLGLLSGGSVFALTLLAINGVPQTVRALFSSHPYASADATGHAADRTANGRTAEHRQDRAHQQLATSAGAAQPGTGSTGPGSEAAQQRKGQAVAQEARSTSTDSASQARSAPAIPAGSYNADLVAPSSIQEYAMALGEKVGLRGGSKTIVKIVANSTEALAAICPPPRKGAWPPNTAITTQRITPTESEDCRHNTRGSLSEMQLGYQAVVIVRSKVYGAPELSPRDLFLALAAEIPDMTHPDVMTPNPNTRWNRVNESLENEPIEVVGPPLYSLTGSALLDLLLEPGCRTFPEIAALEQSNKARFDRICRTVRGDGVYSEMSELPYRVVERLQVNPNTVGIVGYGLFAANAAEYVVSRVGGTLPSLESLASGAYPASRPLYAYYFEFWGSRTLLSQFVELQGRSPVSYSIVPPNPIQRSQP